MYTKCETDNVAGINSDRYSYFNDIIQLSDKLVQSERSQYMNKLRMIDTRKYKYDMALSASALVVLRNIASASQVTYQTKYIGAEKNERISFFALIWCIFGRNIT